MDDFGTGYSSLSYLWRFPFDKIKIDRSFMSGFDGSGRDVQRVVKTIIALGHELHMRLTVEGVETSRQVALLDKADADQGRVSISGARCPPPRSPAPCSVTMRGAWRVRRRPSPKGSSAW
jgi:EAL domain-containing protein (putative c-di-GMP-specific phosphodiesterase class I)